MISVEQIKQLRQATGIPLNQCRAALEAAGGDLETALTVLKTSTAAAAEKKAERATGAGRIGSYLHNDGSLGVVVALGCETDFVAKNSEFEELAHDLAMHIAAASPQSPEELLEQPFLKNPKLTVGQLLQDKIRKFGENIQIRDWQRLMIGRF